MTGISTVTRTTYAKFFDFDPMYRKNRKKHTHKSVRNHLKNQLAKEIKNYD